MAREIGLAVGAVIDRHKVAKRFERSITDVSFAYRRKPESIIPQRPATLGEAVLAPLPDAGRTQDFVSAALADHALQRFFRNMQPPQGLLRLQDPGRDSMSGSTYTWTVVGNTDWNLPGNWAIGTVAATIVPNSTIDSAVITIPRSSPRSSAPTPPTRSSTLM
ncbi:MAG: hypothetical protein M3Y41_05905 [Pseudomonadota bacterium]|nr:hypothetical protein [Pseudomonadota bacterium]